MAVGTEGWVGRTSWKGSLLTFSIHRVRALEDVLDDCDVESRIQSSHANVGMIVQRLSTLFQAARELLRSLT